MGSPSISRPPWLIKLRIVPTTKATLIAAIAIERSLAITRINRIVRMHVVPGEQGVGGFQYKLGNQRGFVRRFRPLWFAILPVGCAAGWPSSSAVSYEAAKNRRLPVLDKGWISRTESKYPSGGSLDRHQRTLAVGRINTGTCAFGNELPGISLIVLLRATRTRRTSAGGAIVLTGQRDAVAFFLTCIARHFGSCNGAGDK